MKIILEKGQVFYQGKFQNLEKLVIENGKISEITLVSAKPKKNKPTVATKKKSPSSDDEFKTIDCEGKYILPGFIDAHTHISLEHDGVGHSESDANEIFGLITPQVRAFDAVNMRDRCFSEAVQSGVTTVMIAPGSANPIGGQCCIVKTVGKIVDESVIRESAGMKFAFGENPKKCYGDQRKFPCTRMGTAAIIREWLMKAQDYSKRKKGKDFKENRDIKLEALIPVIEGLMPVRAHAHQADDIITAYRIGQEFNLDMIFEHCTEGHLIAKELGKWKAKAVVGPLTVTRKKVEIRNRSYETVEALMNEGCIVALTTDHPVMPVDTLNVAAAMCVRHGLDEERALKAITENPAIILGLEKRVGKLDIGFDADVVVWNNHPLDVRSKPEVVFVDGEQIL